MPGLLSSNGGWSFTLRSYCPDSDDESEDDNSETQLLSAFDLSSREDAAQFKPNPWSIAKINAASRPQQQTTTSLSIPKPKTPNQSDKFKQTSPALSSSKHIASHAQPSKSLKESTEKTNNSSSSSKLHFASPVHQQGEISTNEVSTGGAHVNIHSPAHFEPHDSKVSTHIPASPAISHPNNIYQSLQNPGRTPEYKSSRESTTQSIANVAARTPFTVYAPNSHHTPQTSTRFTTPRQCYSSPTRLLNAFDLSSRKDAAQVKQNPWSIAKANAASRPQRPTASFTPSNPKTSNQSDKLKQTSLARVFSKQVASHSQPSKSLKESTEKSKYSSSSSQLHIISPVHQEEISTSEVSRGGAHVNVHSPAHFRPHDSEGSMHITALPAISNANNIHHSLQTPGRTPVHKSSRKSTTPSMANVEAHTPFTVYAQNSHHTPQTNTGFTPPYQYSSSPLSSSPTIYEPAFNDNARHSTSSGDCLRSSPDDISPEDIFTYSGISEASEQNARQNVAYTEDSRSGLSPMTPIRSPLHGTAPPSSVAPSPARRKRRLPPTESPSPRWHRGVVPAYDSPAFSDGDVWSTLPERKNPKLSPRRLHVKTSGKFRLPIALMPPRAGVSIGEKRRVTLYRPPPPMHSPSSEANILKVRRVGRPGREPTDKSSTNAANERGKSDDGAELGPSRGSDSSVQNSTSSPSPPPSHVPLTFPVDRLEYTYAATRRVISDRNRAVIDAFDKFGFESCGIVKRDDDSRTEIEILRWEVGRPHTQDVDCSANRSDIAHGDG